MRIPMNNRYEIALKGDEKAINEFNSLLKENFKKHAYSIDGNLEISFQNKNNSDCISFEIVGFKEKEKYNAQFHLMYVKSDGEEVLSISNNSSQLDNNTLALNKGKSLKKNIRQFFIRSVIEQYHKSHADGSKSKSLIKNSIFAEQKGNGTSTTLDEHYHYHYHYDHHDKSPKCTIL